MRAFFALATALVSCSLAFADRPNVVFIMSDDMGWNDVGYHGSDLSTPNIDTLAAGGVRFDRYYAFPMCWPTRTALMTGRMAVRMGLEYSMTGVPDDEQMLPEVFRNNGYQTWMVGKWHLGNSRVSQFPHRRGFDHFYGHTAQGIDYYSHINRGALDWQRNGKSVREEGYSTDLLTAEALKLLDQRDKSRPFFLYVAYNAPHSPLQAPRERVEQVTGIEEANRRVYAAMVDVMDEGIGRIIKALDDGGIREQTLVVWVSDNGGGGAGSNGQLRDGKFSPFEGGIRVPGLVNWPSRVKAGGTLTQQLIAYDWLPTLAAATGIDFTASKKLDGHNMWPAISQNKNVAPRTRLMGHSGSRMVFQDQWKLVKPAAAGGETASLLFDLKNDPFEKNDVADQHANLVKELEALMPPVASRSASGPIARLDRDGDERLSREETTQPMRDRFDEMDKNGDGFLSRDEVSVGGRGRPGGRPGGAAGRGGPAGRGRPDPSRLFADRDADNDGILAGNEIPDRMKQRLAQLDTDGDGAVSLKEFRAGSVGRRPGGGPGRALGQSATQETAPPVAEAALRD